MEPASQPCSLLAQNVDEFGPFDLSPDGRALVRGEGDTLVVFDLDTKQERARLPAGGPALRERKGGLINLGGVRDVSWSPLHYRFG